uniref:Uncharacterized protein n=1 Tax=Arundo donax TaxID=35708 RepID=A0A0A9FQZ6_ARUDO
MAVYFSATGRIYTRIYIYEYLCLLLFGNIKIKGDWALAAE